MIKISSMVGTPDLKAPFWLPTAGTCRRLLPNWPSWATTGSSS